MAPILRGTIAGELPDGRKIVEMGCGCQYVTAFAPLWACDAHRYIACGKCGATAEVTFMGLICPQCTFPSPAAIATREANDAN